MIIGSKLFFSNWVSLSHIMKCFTNISYIIPNPFGVAQINPIYYCMLQCHFVQFAHYCAICVSCYVLLLFATVATWCLLLL